MKRATGLAFLVLFLSASWLAMADDAVTVDQEDMPMGAHRLLHHGRLPPLGTMDPKVKKCIQDFRSAGSITCFHEIISSFWTHTKSISADCCTKIQSTDEDCSTTLFGHFRHPLFQYLLTEHCSGSDPSAPPPSS